MNDIRVRFAPSPTGPIHIGNMRTALFNYLFAKHEGKADFILRIEDTDATRSTVEYEEYIYKELEWLGIEWDEGPDKGGPVGPYRQSQRLDIYQRYLQKLMDEGFAYRCYCTPEELEADKEQAVRAGDIPRYSGKCRHLSEEEIRRFEAEGRPSVIRFIVPDHEMIAFDDLIKGRIEIGSHTLGGDMIIFRSDNMPTYNFAVVIDDHLMGITHVIRGDDHVANTPKQLLIYKALGFTPPLFAHTAMILGPDRTKLSKRHGDNYIGQYRQKGYLPEALFNFLALLGWSPDDEREIMSKDEIISAFSLNRASRSPAVFDIDKLNWMNGIYIRQSPPGRIAALAVPHLKAAGLIDDSVDMRWLEKAVASVQEGISYVAEIVEPLRIYFGNVVEPENDEAAEVLKAQGVYDLLQRFKELVQQAENIDEAFAKEVFNKLKNDTGLKGKSLFMPIRVALTGRCHGPEMVTIIPLLGRDLILSRLEHILSRLGEDI
ncbi:glutamate--tRNA ligase [Mahella sp.]|uniref:glutamate--tRNA ligase n=1 Tax=Mahella sp. TaxID=2798721 RepID=UPI0025BBA640|nr:glutamate--tRNA ligase [Mahella sp.]MBZ4666844.1 glutamyl-tRNA synthetase [Mahella sp.]